jgi:hypothetical protein
MINNFKMPLMTDNIFRDDINNLIEFLQQDPIPRLTNGPKIWEFEEKWNEWFSIRSFYFYRPHLLHAIEKYGER